VFLDEPTIGLDVTSQVRIREFLKAYQERHGATILLTSHYMQDVKELCERVIIIDQGAKVFDGPFAELTARFSDEKLVRLTFAEPVDEARVSVFGPTVMADGLHAVVRVGRDESARQAGRMLAVLPVADIAIEEADADEVIRQMFAQTAAATVAATETGEFASDVAIRAG